MFNNIQSVYSLCSQFKLCTIADSLYNLFRHFETQNLYFALIKFSLFKPIVLRIREIYRDIHFNLRNVVNKSAKDVLVKMRHLYFREIYSVVSELSQ